MAEGAFNPVNLISFQDPLAALKLQQQQAMAAQLMADSEPRKDINALAGSGPYAQIIPYSPLEGLSKAVERGMGGYMQGQSTAALAKALQGPTQGDLMGNATNAAISDEGGMGPATKGDVAGKYQQQLAGILSGSNSGAMTPQERMLESVLPKAGVAEYEQRMKQQNFTNEAAAKAQFDTVTGPGGRVMPKMPYVSGSPAQSAPNTAAYLPQSLQEAPAAQGNAAPQTGTMPQPQQDKAIMDVFGGGSPQVSLQGQGGPVVLTKPAIDANDPAAVEGAKVLAEEKAKDTASADKGVIGIDSRIENTMKTLDEMAALSPSKAHGWVGENVDVPLSRNVGHGDMANAQTEFERKNANLFTQELGPLMQTIQGTKGSIPLINAIKEASQIPAYGAKKEEIGAINNLKEQLRIYQGNMKNAQAMMRGQTSAPSQITHTYIPGRGIVPQEGQ